MSEDADPHNTKIGRGIMDACIRKREAKQIWKWATKCNYKNREEISDRRGKLIPEIKKTIPKHIQTSIITQIQETVKATQEKPYHVLIGEKVKHRSGEVGRVCRKNKKYIKIQTNKK